MQENIDGKIAYLTNGKAVNILDILFIQKMMQS